ncbi:SDR family oxidoreductase [Sphingomonas corticis]|jgi:NAD(P)-dependent dehydrogenase (short-subunit alcohol dehydrogenase family)|uniref:SDR family oxidoreductase n=1 Tax=Sphingomonas corticis TaxID=2722791 RepID=A0ABX1CM04_9SPHN|nr:SDR family oxidoreductase [Sphingomonas corticis]NJR78444.1 SDR family oxidoreductase [Sphingomonas corticis]
MQGKRVVVTGGTTGIGRAIVRSLASQGARVVTLGRDENALKDALDAMADLPGEVHGIAADLATREGVERLFAEADVRLGGVDALVSNAALGAEPIDEMADDDWRYVVEVNLVAAMAATRAALARLGKGGQIVIVGSISAEIHAPGESVYSATKAGLQGFAETLRKEVEERGLRVALVEPGTTGSDMQEASDDEQREEIAKARMLRAEDVAEAVDFILSRPPRVDVVTLRLEPRLQELP